MPEFKMNYIDEVKVMKSKKNEIIIANENFKLKADKDQKTKKQVLTEVKNDMQQELFVLEKIKQQQDIEKKRREDRINARKVLDNQIDENFNRRQQEWYEKQQEAKKVRDQNKKLVEQEQNERQIKHEKKQALKAELDAANNQAIEHKERLAQKEKEEAERLRKEIEQLAIQEEQKKKEAEEFKRSKETAHQLSLGKLEKASNFNSKLDELR